MQALAILRKCSGTLVVPLSFLALTFMASWSAAGTAAAAQASVSEARFILRDAAGKALPLARSVGAKLSVRTEDGSVRRIRIDAAEPDPRDALGEVVLYHFSVQDADGSWTPYCEPDPDGRRAGFPLASRHLDKDAREDGFFITCAAGAYGKCIRFGYRPWRGKDATDLYRACVRMVRADYCGDGVGYTRNGTPINIYDRRGIQKRDEAPGMSFEAGWGPNGAVCVNKTRVPDVLTLEELQATCPRLSSAVPGCDEAGALRQGALILNESY